MSGEVRACSVEWTRAGLVLLHPDRPSALTGLKHTMLGRHGAGPRWPVLGSFLFLSAPPLLRRLGARGVFLEAAWHSQFSEQM